MGKKKYYYLESCLFTLDIQDSSIDRVIVGKKKALEAYRKEIISKVFCNDYDPENTEFHVWLYKAKCDKDGIIHPLTDHIIREYCEKAEMKTKMVYPKYVPYTNKMVLKDIFPVAHKSPFNDF